MLGTTLTLLALATTALAGIPLRAASSMFDREGSGFCLDVEKKRHPSAGNPTKVILWRCNGQANQRWSFDSESGEIKSDLSSDGKYCLDHAGWPKLAVCDGSASQKFSSMSTSMVAKSNDVAIQYKFDLGPDGKTITGGYPFVGTDLFYGTWWI